MKILHTIFSILLLCGSVCAGTIDPTIKGSKYLEYGQQFECVVQISGTYNDNTQFLASAVLIDDHHFLTAAHVVKNSKVCSILLKDKSYLISHISIHKDFDTQFGSGDIAIGYSEQGFGLEFYPELYSADTEIDSVCSISGYGFTGTFITGATKCDGKKRAGSNWIDSIYRDMLICTPSKKDSSTYTELEFLIASGDSGGGLFIDGKLAGINSCVMVANRSPNSSYGEESGHTRISKFIDWIKQNKRNR